MADEIKCPVCGKVGIPNYHDEDVICPCCESDLSIFRIVDQIPISSGSKTNVWKLIATATITLAVALGAFLVFKPTESADNISVFEKHIACLQDSINNLNGQIQQATQPDINNNVGAFKYTVRKGDSFWSISKRFYNTGNRHKEIAAANGLDINSKLYVGDTIIIKQ